MAADQPKPTAPPVKRPPAGYQPRLQRPPRAPNADPFVSPRLGLSPNSSFIPSVPDQGWQWPGRSQPAPARGQAPPRSQQMSTVSHKTPAPAQPAQIHSQPKWALPVPHQLLPHNIRVTKFVVYLRGRINLRVYSCPVIEVFPPRFESARSAQAIAEQILCLCDIKTVLRCQRVCKQFNSTIRRSTSLQRRLWLTDTHELVPYPDDLNLLRRPNHRWAEK
ncbi:putative F-box domain-containing protein [Septoria linicola]|nr:putative F-box domain-containing protein [Septoria linicola]